MWLWIAAWAAASLVLVLAHRRFRRSLPAIDPEVAAFLVRLETELARSHPDVVFLGVLPDRIACLLRVEGQETEVSLRELFRHADASDDAFTRLVAGLVADIREVGLDRVGDLDFAAAAGMLLPQVRSREWVDQQGTFGDAGLVFTELAAGLCVVYVVDGDSSMVYVCRALLRRWGRSVADVHNLALANLRRLGKPLPDGLLAEPVVLQTQDGYDAARVLLLEPRDGLLVAIPDRDTLWVGPESGQDLARLMATTERIAASSPHAVSPRLFRLNAGRLEPVADPR
jgi:uncharacterized protein YtpQ (UPF0354 family)